MGTLLQDLRYGLRMLAKNPGFTSVAVLTLALGIGASTAVFSVLEGVLLRPLPYPHSDELVEVLHSAPGANLNEVVASPSMYFIYREQNRTFQDIGLYTDDSVSVTGVGESDQVQALRVTDGTLPILGISPMLGRWFTRADDLPSSPDTVMLTYGYWRGKFGGDSSIIGRSITVDGKSRQVIGVLPQRFSFMDQDVPPLILPFKFDRNKTFLGNFSYQAVARLRPEATVAQANADVARMIPIVYRSFPAPLGFSVKLFEQLRIRPDIRPLKQHVVGDVGDVLWILMGSIGIVLMIACANVANLLLVRAEGRQQELAIRAALGATRGRIATELLVESVILGLAGSALGLGLAHGALRFLVAMAPAGLPRLNQIDINGHVLLFTLVVSLLASLLFGSVPVFKYVGAGLGRGLREGGRALSQSRERHRARSTLVIVQVALAFVLLICSGLMIRTLRALTRVQPGFTAPAEVQTFRLSIPEAEVKDSERVAHMQEEILHRIEAIPGVSSAGLCSTISMDGYGSFDLVFAQNRTYAEGKIPPIRRFKFMSPGFLGTLGIPLIAGRDLTWTDIYNKIPVALISENMAREYGHDPTGALGKRIRPGPEDDWREIVGVVADVHDDGMNKEASTSVYWPIMMKRFEGEETMVRRDPAFAIRTSRAGSENLMKDVRQAVWSVDPNLPLADVHTLRYFYLKSMARTSFTLVMLAVAAGMALLLGIVGLYSVLAYSVSQRMREIGIRMALGAAAREVLTMVVKQGAILAAIGIAGGLVAAFGLTRLMASLLYGVRPTDALTFAAVSLVLAGVALLASYIPARRATQVDPMVALRYE